MRKRSEKQIAHSKWLGENSTRLKREKREKEKTMLKKLETDEENIEEEKPCDVGKPLHYYIFGAGVLLTLGCALYCKYAVSRYHDLIPKKTLIVEEPKHKNHEETNNLIDMEG